MEAPLFTGSTLRFLGEGVDDGGSTLSLSPRSKGALIVHSFVEKIKSGGGGGGEGENI